MSVAWKLAWAYAVRFPARLLLTSLAMVASACVVVWVVSGYDAMVSQFGNQATEYLGRYDLFVVPDALDESFVSPQLIDAVRKDPSVAELEPSLQWTVRVQSDKPMEPGMGGPGMGKRGTGGPGEKGPGAAPPPGGGKGGIRRGMFFGSPKLVGLSSTVEPYPIQEGRWLKLGDPALREAVLSDQAARQLQVGLNDDILVICGTKEYRLKVVGTVSQVATPPMVTRSSPTGRPMMSAPPPTLGPAASAVYVPLPLAEKISRRPGAVNLVNIKLRVGANSAEFRAQWLPQVAQVKPAVLLVGTKDLAAAMEEGMLAANSRRQAWAATGMSLLAALFIIFTTLSMGVNERVRQFAVMRAVGLTRSQVAGVIAAESLLLGLIGWGGGLIAGWGLLKVVSSAKPDLFMSGVSLGAWCIGLTGLSAVGGALAAAVLPAWHATQIEPLEAMTPRAAVRPRTLLVGLAGVVGLALIAVNPALVFFTPIPDAARYAVYEALGCTTMALGFLLLAPLAIVCAEALLGPWLARLLGLQPRLFQLQLSGNLWRTLGTTAALSVGLGLYVAMMVWGYSMLQPFTPGHWAPDLLAAFQQGGLPDTEIDAMRRIAGVRTDQCIPLAVEQPRLAGDITGSQQGNSVTRQDNVILIGLDPQTAFAAPPGGSKPLVDADFVQGTSEEALAKLKQGRYCVVPDHFLAATGLKVGDRFGMTPPDMPNKTVEYTIAGAVSLPGWHWMTKFSGLRRRSGRSAAMVFAPYDDVRRDFDIHQINFFWMNLRPDADPAEVGTAMQPIADRNLGETQPVNMQGTWSVGATMFGRSLRLSTPGEVTTRILARADDMIWAMCQLPLITLLVTSLGVVNTIVASVRARRWEMGILRAVGVGRWALCRIILGEGLLIGLIACLISLAFGVMAGWCGIGISQYVSFFGGMATPLFVPWAKLSLGFGAALGLSFVAALWPAISTGRREPLALLQEGRAAT